MTLEVGQTWRNSRGTERTITKVEDGGRIIYYRIWRQSTIKSCYGEDFIAWAQRADLVRIEERGE